MFLQGINLYSFLKFYDAIVAPVYTLVFETKQTTSSFLFCYIFRRTVKRKLKIHEDTSRLKMAVF